MTVLRPHQLPSGAIVARAAVLPVPSAAPPSVSYLLINSTDRLLLNGAGDRLIISGA